METENTEQIFPFVKLPLRTIEPNATVLIVGALGSGKRQLARYLIDPQFQNNILHKLWLNIRTSESLPLLIPPLTKSRPRIDYVIFLISMTQPFDQCKQHIRSLDDEYFLGRCCIIVTDIDKPAEFILDRSDIHEYFREAYPMVPVFYADLTNLGDVKSVTRKVIKVLECGCGFNKVSSSVLKIPATHGTMPSVFEDFR